MDLKCAMYLHHEQPSCFKAVTAPSCSVPEARKAPPHVHMTSWLCWLLG